MICINIVAAANNLNNDSKDHGLLICKTQKPYELGLYNFTGYTKASHG